MATTPLFIDLHIEKKVGKYFGLLFNVDNFNTDDITEKLNKIIEKFGADLKIKVEKLCFYTNEDRLNPVHAVRQNELNNLATLLAFILRVSKYSNGDELKMNAILGAFENTSIPVLDLNDANVEAIVATTYYVRDNFKTNESGQKIDIRNPELLYREVGRGICVGLNPTHPFQTQTRK